MKHRQNRYRFAAGFVTLSGLVLGLVLADQYEPPVAIAADDMIFAPQVCVAIEDGSEFVGNAEYRVGEVEQTEEMGKGDYQTFICPLVREEVRGVLAGLWVRVGNENKKEDTPPICCIHAVSLGGSHHDYQCEEASNKEERQSLEFDDIEDLETYDHGHYVVTCELGYEDTILSIRTSEKEANEKGK
jgi:hypothetical protein